MKTYVYSAAGGNPTAINFDEEIPRDAYSGINAEVQSKNEDIEQVGFEEKKDGIPALQMAGGEFCGNATRSFACLLKEQNPEMSNFIFRVSGFPEIVSASVEKTGEKTFFCKARFPGLAKLGKVEEKELNGFAVKIVDLGGIIHIVVDEKNFSFAEDDFESDMKKIKDALQVDCDAVGVVWCKRNRGKVSMKPVVWVKAIDTCYYETSCGSGSIAIGLVMKEDVEVVQPSGKDIKVAFDGDAIVLSSEMEKIMEL